MNHLPSTVTFREDINGLRAWAVSAVLFFHFKLFGITGGFVGVDIFFVISGFLMTAIITKGLEKESFSILKFYMARARRILPALMVLIVVLLVLGWFWLPTPDYKTLGTQGGYSLAFISNIYYFTHSGYFDIQANEKWLLHTWSLSVEWQFYMLFPIYLMCLWKFKQGLKPLVWGVGILFVFSLLLSVLITASKPTASFYLLPTRGWELATGGLVYLITRFQTLSTKLKTVLFWVGWVLVIGSIVLISSDRAWPGLLALIPVGGTALIILAQRSGSFLVANPISQWLGDRSYSIYLWHWPLVVGLYFSNLNQNWVWIWGAVIMSLLLGHLSFRWIEIPTRQYLMKKTFRKEIIVIVFACLIIGTSAVCARLFIFDGRLSVDAENIANKVNDTDPRRDECLLKANEKGSPGCIYGTNTVGAILVGDSHAASIATAFGVAAEKFDKGIVLLSYNECRQLKNGKTFDIATGTTNIRCMEFNKTVVDKMNSFSSDIPMILVSRMNVPIFGHNELNRSHEKKLPTVFFTKMYQDSGNLMFQQEFKNALINWACDVAENRPVYLTRSIPELIVDIPNTLSRNIIFGRGNEDITILLKDYHERNKLVWQAQDEAVKKCGVKILNPLPYLCDKEFCFGSVGGQPRYVDDDHLSEFGNKLLVPMFEEIFESKVVH